MFNFIRNCPTAVQSGCTSLHPTKPKGFTSVYPYQHLKLLVLFCLSCSKVTASNCDLNLHFPKN